MNDTNDRYRSGHADKPGWIPCPAKLELPAPTKKAKLGEETVLGGYHVVVMPDGTPVPMTKLTDGTWVRTEERLKGATTEFEHRFKDTETQPNDWKPSEGVGAVNPDIKKMVDEARRSKDHLNAYLVARVTDPKNIIARDPLALERIAALYARPLDLREVLVLIDLLNDPVWNQALPIIKREKT